MEWATGPLECAVHSTECDTEPFEKLWQKKVFDLLLKRGKIDQSLVTQMLGWQLIGRL
ncbi:hypothetical protein IIC65_01485, partial [Candidatus Sumerlaeota bacterium]|nr:hypothetical protein [Candidatus Sumerlaeota bacterium]